MKKIRPLTLIHIIALLILYLDWVLIVRPDELLFAYSIYFILILGLIVSLILILRPFANFFFILKNPAYWLGIRNLTQL